MTDEVLIGYVLFAGAAGLVGLGLAGMVLSRHLFRIVLALAIAEAGANLFLVLAGYRWDAVAPILTGGTAAGPMVDPVPQAMVLTAIVIGVGVQALALTLAIRIRRAWGTLDMEEVRLRMEREIGAEAGVGLAASEELPAGGRPLPPRHPALPSSGEARP